MARTSDQTSSGQGNISFLRYLLSYLYPFPSATDKSTCRHNHLGCGDTRESKSVQTLSMSERIAPEGGESRPPTILRTASVSRVETYSEARELPLVNMSDFRQACMIVEQFSLSDCDLLKILSLLVENMKRGLSDETYAHAKGKSLSAN